MRVPLMPLALSLAVGGLLYAAYQGNKRIVEGVASRPAVAAPAARSATPPRATADDATSAPPESPEIAQREALRDGRCL
jgi:hypothetical protein